MKQDDSVFLAQSRSLPFVEMRTACDSFACYQAHSHDEFSFGVIDGGSASYRNLKKVHNVHRGHTVTINPGDMHSCNPDKAQWSYRMLFVDTHWIGQLQQEWTGKHGQDYLPFIRTYEQRPNLYAQFHQLYQALLLEDNALATESLMIEYLATVFGQPQLEGKSIQKPEPNLNRVLEMMGDQLDKNIALDDFAQEANMSRYQLIRAFNHHFGLSPHAYQLDQRIIKAKSLLKNGLSLAETATETGFSDQAHFQRHFKKRLAITPKHYQSFFVE
ncbi:AraC family transcriptional regulator [Vibrio nigripulchritudo]|uniref:AraC family transcriptional regulator n=1 Tax=Vibrio nigripulchritudo TaxID=28173 RepID=UPI0005FA1A28|nr:AraC family transcriptional regulator [Vibrio nigripulchritudo]KJY78676.1 transcriptional regulator [Vibrio nigripulchritudo]